MRLETLEKCNILLAKVKSTAKNALPVLSFCIIATFLNGGRTVHVTFKITLNICNKDNTSVIFLNKLTLTN